MKKRAITVIPVVNSPIDIYNDVTIPDERGVSWWYIALIILIAILVLIILWPVMPYIFQGLWWIISNTFKLFVKMTKKINKRAKEKRAKRKEKRSKEV